MRGRQPIPPTSWRHGDREEFERRVRELATFSVENALARGFAPRTWQNLPGSLALVVTELDELVDVHTEDLPRAMELADAGLRLLGILEVLFKGGWSVVTCPILIVPNSCQPQLTLWPIITCKRYAIAAWRKRDESQVLHWLQQMFACIVRAGEVFEVDFVEALQCKASQNALRPQLHGALEDL